MSATGINCDHCGKDPGYKAGSEYAWNGFKDANTGEFVCFSCRRPHYAKKQKTEHRGVYQELPVNVESTLLIMNYKKRK